MKTIKTGNYGNPGHPLFNLLSLVFVQALAVVSVVVGGTREDKTTGSMKKYNAKRTAVQPDVKFVVALILAVVMTLMSMWLLMHA